MIDSGIDSQRAQPACFAFCRDSSQDAGVAVIELGGKWLVANHRPRLEGVLSEIKADQYRSIVFDGAKIDVWDSALLVFVRGCIDWADEQGLKWDLGGLPEGARNLVKLSKTVPVVEQTGPGDARGWLTHVGSRAWETFEGFARYCAFLGELLLDFVAFFRGRAQMRKSDFLFVLQSAGPMAVPIVCLLSFLTGLIIAFIGVIQLQKLAADIFVADLVGLATTRELGSLMTGVIMAGRTGAAFAAQLGSMRVNEEIDALTTFGISPMQFLVLPRVLALIIMMPLLCVCANFVAMFGGMVVAIGISEVSMAQYIYQIDYAVSLIDLGVGIFKSIIFGVIIAVAGCYRGLNCGKDATAVGLATTSAVVTAITWIVVADALFAVSFHLIGI